MIAEELAREACDGCRAVWVEWRRLKEFQAAAPLEARVVVLQEKNERTVI
jgi:hypothetical protein